MTIHFRPLPAACEPECIRKARLSLDLAWNHPDAAEIGKALDVLSHALLRIGELSETIADAAVREAISQAPYGMLCTISDSVADVAYALDNWRDDPWNEPGWLAQCDAADARIDAEKEARL